jgi:MFS family permease
MRNGFLVALVALAALTPIALTGPQDRTRYELTRHVALHRTIRLEPGLFDRSIYNGHTYADKAPGLSFAAIPAFELERATGIAKAPHDWHSEGDASLWLMRVLSSGVLFVIAVLIVLRLAGAFAAAVFGVATLAAPLAPTFFEHDAAGALAIGAFALLRKNLFLAGVCAGLAVCVSYQTALIALVLLVGAVWRWRRDALLFVAGLVPPAVALGAYDQIAFGSPFHLSYRYVANRFTERQHAGFFGIGYPTLHGIFDVLVGSRGLFVWSPVCVAAVVGLVIARRWTPLVIVALFVLVDAGYFLPYGGGSPGPRFLGASLPFLALGLPAALERFRLPTLGLAFVSAVTMTVQALSWGVRSEHDTAYVPGKNDVMATIWSLGGLNRDTAAVIVLLCALAAVVMGAHER